MSDQLTIKETLNMSMELWEKNKHKWSPMESEYGKDFILYMVEEIGEVISIIKKKGHQGIMNDENVRERFIEEMCDVLMYYSDVLNRFDVSSEELTAKYIEKFESNMNRNYEVQYNNLFDEDTLKENKLSV